MPQPYWTPELIKIAKEFMLEFLSAKTMQPSDFDAIIGREGLVGFDLGGLLTGEIKWNKTIFCKALGDLIDEGKVKFWVIEREYFYKISEG
jgi:hypothetical protein